MSNIITAGNATNNGTSISSDTSGVLELKTGSTPTTALTIGTSGQVGVGSTPSYGTSGQVLTSQGSSAAPVWATASGGKILQVVSTTKTDTFSTTSLTPVDITGLSISITPTLSTSKILITGSVCWGNSDSIPYLVGIKLVRNSTDICIADAAGNRSRWTIGAQGVYTPDNTVFAPLNFLDSPATTSATTYKLQGSVEGGRTLWINRGVENDGDSSNTGRFISTITLMEVAA
jgi:hypothetical protein